MFVPSPDLLAQWQLKYRVMDERTWEGVYKVSPSTSYGPSTTPRLDHRPFIVFA